MKHFLVIGLLAMTVIMTGCPAEKNRSNGATNRVGRGGNTNGNGQTVGPNGAAQVPVRPTGGGSGWGLVYPEAGNIQSSHPAAQGNWQANDMSRWFLSTDFHPDDVGATTKEQDPRGMPCGSAQYCAVEFTVSQATIGNNMTLVQATQQGQAVPIQSGILGMAFWDSMVGKVDSEGVPFSAIPVYVQLVNQGAQAQSTIQGNRIIMTFQDQKGVVQFDGTLSGSQYAGQVYFQNYVNYNGGSDWSTAGKLGRFAINACSIFRCQ